MTGDKVTVQIVSEEIEGKQVISTALGQKPQFMLDEEYNKLLLECITDGLKTVLMQCFPGAEAVQKKIAKGIADKI